MHWLVWIPHWYQSGMRTKIALRTIIKFDSCALLLDTFPKAYKYRMQKNDEWGSAHWFRTGYALIYKHRTGCKYVKRDNLKALFRPARAQPSPASDSQASPVQPCPT